MPLAFLTIYIFFVTSSENTIDNILQPQAVKSSTIICLIPLPPPVTIIVMVAVAVNVVVVVGLLLLLWLPLHSSGDAISMATMYYNCILLLTLCVMYYCSNMGYFVTGECDLIDNFGVFCSASLIITLGSGDPFLGWYMHDIHSVRFHCYFDNKDTELNKTHISFMICSIIRSWSVRQYCETNFHMVLCYYLYETK